MKRIGITPRRDRYPERDEERDALDSRLAQYLWAWGFLPLPLATAVEDPVSYLAALAPDGYLLSGGNDIGDIPQRDALEAAALQHAIKNHLPVVGICRGMQMINHYQGGTLRTVNGHVATTHRIDGPLLQKAPHARDSHSVNSFHHHAIYADSLGSELEALAWAEDGSIEALRHTRLPWLGIMWHPERNTPVHTHDRLLITTLFNQGKVP